MREKKNVFIFFLLEIIQLLTYDYLKLVVYHFK
jgi:hypothetical protein